MPKFVVYEVQRTTAFRKFQHIVEADDREAAIEAAEQREGELISCGEIEDCEIDYFESGYAIPEGTGESEIWNAWADAHEACEEQMDENE